MKNCIWLLQKSAKACPQRLPAMLLVTLLDAVNAVNIILFYKYAVQALYQKAFEVSVDAMKRLKDAGKNVRWYVLGEGDQRKKLQEQIDALGLTEDFILYGAVNNPYPFMKQADIYVHASRFEGKSIAIQEAQILGKPMVVSDCSGNREQVCHGKDGLMCGLTPDSLAENIMLLLEDEALRGKLGAAAAKKNADAAEEIQKLLSMLKG